MNILQTLYIDSNKNYLTDSFGWAAPEYHLMSWALSCLQLRKFYPQVTLYANSPASHLLVDILGLPYNEVYVTHDKLNLINSRLWALPKIFTYAHQKDPFLHVDGDVFTFAPFAANLMQGELIAQNIEEATSYYLSTQLQLTKHLKYIPSCAAIDFARHEPIRAANAGILGGNNIDFIIEYAYQAQEYVKRNKYCLAQINIDRFNVFFEQHLFYCLAKEKDIPINVLFQNIVYDNEYKYLGDFHKVPFNQTYVHLLGHYKQDECTCVQMAMRLRDLYPEYYYRIVALFRHHKLPFFIDYSLNQDIEKTSVYQNLHSQAKQQYNLVTKTKFQKQHKYPSLALLHSLDVAVQDVIDTTVDSSQKIDMQLDYHRFQQEWLKYYASQDLIEFNYIYGRDLEAVSWYETLFARNIVLSCEVIRCPEVTIIESKYDWARLINQRKRIGVKYYEEVEIISGCYFNLLVPEVHHERFSFFDIDELEKTILDQLFFPRTLKSLLESMYNYADEDIRHNHLTYFNEVVLSLVKQLVVQKAIRPI